MESGSESGERTGINEDEISAADVEKEVSFRDLVSRIHLFFMLFVTTVYRI
jgi:hypothetical protein